jgi:hypothetical protein
MILEALAFLEIARKDGRHIGMVQDRPLSDAVFGDPDLATAILDACSTTARSLLFAAATAGARNRVVLVQGRAVGMPSEGGGKHTIQEGQSLARGHQGAQSRMSLGHQRRPEHGLALVPLKIGQLSIWATDHRDVFEVGPRAE